MSFCKIILPKIECKILLHLDVILVLLLLTETFFSFQSQLYFSCVLLMSLNVLLILLNAQIVDIEYAQGICSTIFVVEEFSGSFPHPSISLKVVSTTFLLFCF